MMIIRHAIFALIHVAIALLVIGLLYSQYANRRTEVERTLRSAQLEHAETERLEYSVQVRQDVLTGVRDGDPFVVEMLARDHLDFSRPGELSPPPLPAEVDRQGPAGNQ